MQDASESISVLASRCVPECVRVPVGCKCVRACMYVRACASLYVFASKASLKVEHLPLEVSQSIFMSKFQPLFSLCAVVDVSCYFSMRIQ
jgi:hypothetical protein